MIPSRMNFSQARLPDKRPLRKRQAEQMRRGEPKAQSPDEDARLM